MRLFTSFVQLFDEVLAKLKTSEKSLLLNKQHYPISQNLWRFEKFIKKCVPRIRSFNKISY